MTDWTDWTDWTDGTDGLDASTSDVVGVTSTCSGSMITGASRSAAGAIFATPFSSEEGGVAVAMVVMIDIDVSNVTTGTTVI
ncbi:MAG: hypothetical protein GY741_09245 [Phycisphaeraceae bacterium]|nr:hypothetical protein [Phycisphaeraceae bacterium]